MGFDGGAVQRGSQAMLASQKTVASKFQSMWSGAASSIATIFSGVSVGMVFNSILTKVSEIKNEAIQTGFDTDSVQKFNYQLRQMHIDINAGQTGLGIMNKLIGQAAEGEKKAVDIFSRWGIATNGKSNADIFEEIRAKTAETVDPAQRVAMAMELFGRGGRELLPYLTASKELLDGMAAHAPVISKTDIENIDQAHQKIQEVNDTLTVVSAKGIGKVGEMAGAAPGITLGAMAEGLVDFNSPIGQKIFNKKTVDAPTKTELDYARNQRDLLKAKNKPAVAPGAVPKWHVTENTPEDPMRVRMRWLTASDSDRARMIADRAKPGTAAQPEIQFGKLVENTNATASHLAKLVTGGAIIQTHLNDD